MNYMDFEISAAKNTIEGRANEHVKGMPKYRMSEEPKPLNSEEVLGKLEKVIEGNKLPKITMMMCEANPNVFGNSDTYQRMEAALLVLPKVVVLIKEGFEPILVRGMLNATLCEVAFGEIWAADFEMKFDQLRSNKFLRKEVWGVVDHVSLFVAKSILADIMAGINIDNPTKAEWKKSTSAYTARQFRA